MNKFRLDQALVNLKLAPTRSQAENYIKLGYVQINGKTQTKAGIMVSEKDKIELISKEQYVSRAGLKLASVAKVLNLDFRGKTVLDVGSSTGGFTDYALQHGAVKVFAVDVGTDQLHPSLRSDKRIELHEKTDIRDVILEARVQSLENSKLETLTSKLYSYPDVVLADVSFISLRQILPHVSSLMSQDSILVAMVKPQFEAGANQVNKGVIKNDRVRREILKDFEDWSKKLFVIKAKADSSVAGAKGNLERFFLLKKMDNRS